MRQAQNAPDALHYWRTVSGQDVDFVRERGRSLVAFKVKASSQAHHSDCDNLCLFLKEYPESACGVFVYGGWEIRVMDKKIVALRLDRALRLGLDGGKKARRAQP